MLGYLFGFNARIGRLHYFLSSIALAIVTAILISGVVSSSLQDIARGMPLSQMKWPLIAIAMIFGLVTFMLQSMRFRDIGWDPVCVIPGWIALVIVDQVIATKIPAVSLGHDHPGTIVGALANLGLVLALTFWPSSRHEHWTPRFDMPLEPPDAAPRRQDAATLAASRMARVAGGEFGRR